MGSVFDLMAYEYAEEVARRGEENPNGYSDADWRLSSLTSSEVVRGEENRRDSESTHRIG